MQKLRFFFLAVLCSVFGFTQIADFSVESALNSPVTFGIPEYGTESIMEGTLYSNGPFINAPGTPDRSLLQDATLSMTVYGFGHALSSGYRVADDWVVTETVQVDNIQFYAYQTGSSTTSTINHVSLAIWDGDPSDPASTIVWGDQTTNVFTSSTWTGAYRSLESAPNDTSRPIMITTVNTPGLTLTPGTYWLDWNSGGTLASGPWAVPITITGQIGTGNAKQFDTVGWVDLMDIEQQGLSFEVNGTVVTEPGDELCNDTEVAIATNGVPYTSTIEVTDSGVIGTADGEFSIDAVLVDIQHTWASDLEIVLVSPSGTEVALTTDNGGSSGLDTRAVLTFTDSSTNDVIDWDSGAPLADYRAEGGDTVHPVGGTDGPGVNLNDEFAGEEVNGTWTLRVYDDAAGDSGTLYGFCMQLSGGSEPGDECEWTVTVFGSGFGDEVSWEFRDSGGVVLLSGGPYDLGYSDTQTVTAADPVEFYIESMGTFGDNTPSFMIENGNGVILNSSIAGGTEATYSDLLCSTPPLPTPDNDDCEDAIALACGESDSGSTSNATNSGGNAAADVFYSYTGTGTAELVTVSLCGSAYDTYLRVFSDCTLTNEIAFNDDSCDLQSELSFLSDGTSTYMIMVEGFSANAGDYTISITCEDAPEPPVNCEDFVVPSNNLENGLFFEGDTAQHLAADIPVGENGFTIYGVTPTVIDYATTFEFTFYEDAGGLPGAVFAERTGTIFGSEVTGNNFGYDFVKYQVTFEALTFEPNTRYWMEIESDALAWESNSAQFMPLGAPDVFYNVNVGEGVWTSTGGDEFVFELICEELGVSDMTSFDFAYYPNPVKDVLNINAKKGVESVSAFNLAGQQVIKDAKVSNGQIDVNSLTPGTYVFRVTLEGGQVETFKIIKK